MFLVTAVEKKTNDWWLLSLITPDSEEVHEVSINRKDRDGNAFPGFDDIKIQSSVAGTLWTSAKGKQYLFAPKKGKPTSTRAVSNTPIDKQEKILNGITDIKFNQIALESKVDLLLGHFNLKPRTKIANTNVDYPTAEDEGINTEDIPFK